jgi:hypothetical protein
MLENDGCQFGHDPTICRCHLPIIHLGQDESTYKEFSYSKKQWKVNGRAKIRPKNDGKSLMISAFQSAYRGFGFELTEEELSRVNKYRNNEGYWDYDQFAIQVTDLMDTIEAIYGNMQMVIEVDHSSGHLKKKENGLDVGAMNLYFGGVQRSNMRDTIVTEDYLGNEPGRSLQPGDIQHKNFREGDVINIYRGKIPPPKYDEKTKKMKKKDGNKVEVEHTIEGYIGKPLKDTLGSQKEFIKFFTKEDCTRQT